MRRYLHSFESFLPGDNDDWESLSRFQIFESNAKIAFEFSNHLITDKESIEILIQKYNETYLKNNEWSGGPPNKEFVSYFREKYNVGSQNNFKPTIRILIDIKDFGVFNMGFGIISKKCVTSGKWESEIQEDNVPITHDEIFWYMDRYFDKGILITDIIEELSLKVDNYFDWKWISK